MSTTADRFAQTLRHIRALAGEPGRLGDGQLLGRFLRDRDEAAFAELLRRYGPLVLGVARRRLADRHAAEDVFQATFLTLARQAPRIARRPLAGWLYTVASRLARKEQARVVRRPRLTSDDPPAPPGADPLAEVSGRELVAVIDEELARLPEAYRLPLLLCGLDDLSRDEAAVRLGWSLGTLRGRLERGRELLRKRLEARGLTVPAVLAASLVTEPARAVPAELVRAVTRAALAAPAPAAALKVLSAALAVIALGAGIGVAMLSGRPTEAPAAPQPPAVAAQPVARVDALGDPLPDRAIARLGTLRLRPGGSIVALTFSPDGRRFACWSKIRYDIDSLTVWETATSQLLRRVDIPGGNLKALHWLADGRGVAVLRISREEYYVWDFADEKAPVPKVPAGAEVNSSRDGTLLAVTASPDGRWLAAGRVASQNQPQEITLWELALNKSLGELKSRAVGTQVGHGAGLVFTPDSRTLLAFSRKIEPHTGIGGRVTVQFGSEPPPPGEPAEQARLVAWDVATGRERQAFDLTAPGGFTLSFGLSQPVPQTFAVTPDGQTLVIGQKDGHVRLWDWQAGKERRSFQAHPEGSRQRHESAGVIALAVNSDGKMLTTAGMFGGPRRWELPTGRVIGSDNEGHHIFQSLVVSPNSTLLAGGTTGGLARVWDLATGADHCPMPGHSSGVEQVHVLPNGRTALTAAGDDTVRWWDILTGREQRQVKLETSLLAWPGVFTPDGRALIGRNTWSGIADHEKFVWDTSTGKQQPLPDAFTPAKCWILTPPVNGSVLLLDRGDQTATLRDWPSGRLRQTFRPPTLGPSATSYQTNAAALAADGRLAAIVGEDLRGNWRGDGWVSLMNANSGEVAHRWNTPDAIYHLVAITPDGSGVVLGGSPKVPPTPVGTPRPPWKPEQALLLLDSATGKSVRWLTPLGMDPTGYRYLTALAVSPDGRQLAAAERDFSIWVYELASGQARRKLTGHTNEVTALAFTPDGRRLVSASRDLTGLVWDW